MSFGKVLQTCYVHTLGLHQRYFKGSLRLTPSASLLVVRFLFKKGDALSLPCYRPECLLDTAYKILS